jgi:hypothetical protein
MNEIHSIYIHIYIDRNNLLDKYIQKYNDYIMNMYNFVFHYYSYYYIMNGFLWNRKYIFGFQNEIKISNNQIHI